MEDQCIVKDLKIDGHLPNYNQLRKMAVKKASEFLEDEQMKKSEYVKSFTLKLTSRHEKGLSQKCLCIEFP